jgi:hypothetical protein
MDNIVAAGEHDVLCGRGGHTIHWSGNIKFRALVEQHRARYHSASRVEKGRVVAEVVQIWRTMAPPGRFLTPKDPKLGDASTFVDIGDKAAQKKTAKRLRESLPESTTTTTSTVVSMSSNSSTTSSSDNDSSFNHNENNKRCVVVRRVSSDSMEKAAKRARMEYLTTATSELVEIPSMKLLFEAPTFATSTLETEYTNSSNSEWGMSFLESALETATEDDLDLDSLLEEDDMEPIFQTDLELQDEQQDEQLLFSNNNMDKFHESWLSMSANTNTADQVDAVSMFASAFDIFGGSIALNEIAGSIPSAACLTEGHIFD